MSTKSFTGGLITGALIGATIGIITDPIKDKQFKQMNRQKRQFFKMVGSAIDNFMDMF